jgi:hypothetical protein
MWSSNAVYSIPELPSSLTTLLPLDYFMTKTLVCHGRGVGHGHARVHRSGPVVIGRQGRLVGAPGVVDLWSQRNFGTLYMVTSPAYQALL